MGLEKYKELYLTEARKQVIAIESAVVSLRGSPTDAESLEGVSRAAHTLKGMSATMGYEQLARLSGQLEKLLDRVGRGAGNSTLELADLLSDCAVALRVLLEDVVAGRRHDVDLAPLLGRMRPFV